MPDGIEIDASSLSLLEERLTKLAELIIDLRSFWPLVIPLYSRWMGKQFETAGEFFGTQWQELSPDYAAWKSQAYPTRGLLMAEGDLRHAAQTPTRLASPHMLSLSIEPYTKARGPGAGRRIEPGWFQEGTLSMPARPLLPIDGELPVEAQAEIGEAATVYVQDAARRLGL